MIFLPFLGTVYRAHHPNWLFSVDLQEGTGPSTGRFSPPGITALYASLRIETAWLEAQQAFPFKAAPLQMQTYDVSSPDVLDLSTPEWREEAGISLDVLHCAWEAERRSEPACWKLTLDLRNRGCTGIIVPSFAPGATADAANIALWSYRAQHTRPSEIDHDLR